MPVPSRLFLAALLFSSWRTMLLRAETPDPVEELRAELRVMGSGRRQFRDKEGLEFQKAALEKLAAALHTPGELGRALLLVEWNLSSRDTAQVSQAVRDTIATAFRKTADDELRSNAPTKQQATATLVGELAIAARTQWGGIPFAQEQMTKLGPALAEVTKSKDTAVAASAALALGKVDPAPGVAVPALKRMLGLPDAIARRAAARALSEMTEIATDQEKRARINPLPRDKMALGKAVMEIVPAAGAGLDDADAEVRRSCLEAMARAARAAQMMFPAPLTPRDFPPAGKPLKEEERLQLADQMTKARFMAQEFLLVNERFKAEMGAIIKALGRSDVPTVIAAATALEAIGDARARWRRWIASIPQVEAKDKPIVRDDLLADALQSAVPELTKQLTSKEVTLRLASLYALESFGDLSGPAMADVAQSLHDSNAYVRWGAVRVLGHMPPKEGELAVPRLAGLLKDDNEYVRATTILVLARYGPSAKAAVPELAKTVAAGDARFRVQAMRALEAIGDTASQAVPQLRQALGAKEPDVRKAAAQTLGKLGPLAISALPELRKALDDGDAAVRLAASEALLRVTK